MPRVFDNIDQSLLPALKEALAVSERADFCVGYFNLRGWKTIDALVDQWSGNDEECCRLLVGMQTLPRDELEEAFAVVHDDEGMDNQSAIQKKRELAEEFRRQLMLGAPTNEDEAGLRRLAAQLRAGKLRVKLFLRHRLHAKLYLAFRTDPNNPIIGFLGSSNLTFSGLHCQGELNIDVLDHDACAKLRDWFEDRWMDRWCIDVSKELADIIDESWASPEDRLKPTQNPAHHAHARRLHFCFCRVELSTPIVQPLNQTPDCRKFFPSNGFLKLKPIRQNVPVYCS